MTSTAHAAAARAAAIALALGVSLAVSAARAQDAGPKDPAVPPQPGKPDEKAPAATPEGAEKVAERMSELYSRASGPRPMPNPREPDAKVKAEQVRRLDEWKASVEALASAADAYVKQVGSAAPSARALFWGGYGKAVHADVNESLADAQNERATAVKLLRRSLEGLPADADFRADAVLWLGRTQCHLIESGGATVEEAVANLRDAAVGLLNAKRNVEAGQAAIAALKELNARRMDAQARAFGDAIGASKADFGTQTALVRRLLARSATGVGAPLPDLPDFDDAGAADSPDGKPVAKRIEWKSFRGAPLVIHFFMAGGITGRASEQRDVETTLRPIWDRLHGKGLAMVGVSMDRAIPKDEAKRIQEQWDEDGTKELFQDGSRSAVRHYAEVQGIEWPWYWDGTWSKNPISQALGDAGSTAAHAVLVDAQGVIRWRGDAPFLGLAEAADKVVLDAKK